MLSGIRQLQCVLLKSALVVGVHVHDSVSFGELVLPCTHPQTGERVGWRAEFEPVDHYLSNFEFDAVIAADGKKNSLPGFCVHPDTHSVTRATQAFPVVKCAVNSRLA
jgi:hypothetical protein